MVKEFRNKNNNKERSQESNQNLNHELNRGLKSDFIGNSVTQHHVQGREDRQTDPSQEDNLFKEKSKDKSQNQKNQTQKNQTKANVQIREDKTETPIDIAGISDRNTKQGAMLEEKSDRMAAGTETTGGDVHSDQAQAKVVGEEAIGGTTPTPDQDVVDDIAASAGVEIPDEQPVNVRPRVEQRDQQRWELDPKSAGR